MSAKNDYIRWKYGEKSPLEKLVEKYPDKDWDWDYISANPNISMEWVEKYPDKDWDWDYNSSNYFQKKPKISLKTRICY